MIAVRPPDYFPGLAFMALAAHVDVLVLADTFEYSRQSHQNRAKLRNPQGWQWISVPLRSPPRHWPIDRTEVDNSEPWQRKHWRAFEYNYRSTPFFDYYEPQFAPLFLATWTGLADLTCKTASVVHAAFDLESRIVRASSMAGRPETLPEVMTAMGRDALCSLPDAAERNRDYVDVVEVLEFEPPVYRQAFEGFEPGMSAVDLLFNYGPESRAILAGAVRG